MPEQLAAPLIHDLQQAFGGRVELDQPLARFTSARIGGPADALLVVRSADELAEAVVCLWRAEAPFTILGGGSNVLVSDAGIRGVVLVNKARKVIFDEGGDPPTVWAESGANFGAVARQAVQRDLSGLEWAAGIPGTIGGAAFGNAGAHGSEMSANLLMAEILHHDKGQQRWPLKRMDYSYRSSILKRQPGQAVVLAAKLQLAHGDPEEIRAKMEEYLAFRQETQPHGASMGSMFKNPEGDFAGRLIDAAGLKGLRVGAAEISPMHANFFINHGDARADDVLKLLTEARQQVLRKFGVKLALEVELFGQWDAAAIEGLSA
jgi:UDP-N-acetylmuramate dehydrogenase